MADAVGAAGPSDAVEWQTEFVEDVDVRKLHFEGIDPNWTSTKSYSREDIGRIVDGLAEVQNRRRDGWAETDFDRLRDSGDPHDQFLSRTERAFYPRDVSHPSGSEITIDLSERGWSVQNGRHRAWIARERGLETIPAIVKAPEGRTISEIRRT